MNQLRLVLHLQEKIKDGAILIVHLYTKTFFDIPSYLKKDLSESNNRSFTLREITDWITANKEGNINKPNKQRIENPQKTIKNKLQNLVQLELLRIAGNRPVAKGTGTTPIYQFTEYADLLALIIESFEFKSSQEFSCICNEIFNILCTIFPAKEGSTSTTVFYSNFFKKCKENGVFEYIVVLFRDIVAHITSPVPEMEDLFGVYLCLVLKIRD